MQVLFPGEFVIHNYNQQFLTLSSMMSSLSPATHNLFSFSHLTELLASLCSLSTKSSGILALTLLLSGKSFELMIWNTPANTDPHNPEGRLSLIQS